MKFLIENDYIKEMKENALEMNLKKNQIQLEGEEQNLNEDENTYMKYVILGIVIFLLLGVILLVLFYYLNNKKKKD